jgi:tripartite-type tricarboxylate transporter receptor subunit TctC
VPGYEAVTWFGLAAPAGTPKEIINKLNAAAVEGAKSPAFVSRMRDLSFDIIGGSPEDMGALTKSSVDRWVPVVKASGAKID